MHGVKGLRSDPEKKKTKYSYALSRAFLFFQAERWHDVAKRYEWSDTPLRAGQSPAAAHCAELRSFRRGCMALRSREDNV